MHSPQSDVGVEAHDSDRRAKASASDEVSLLNLVMIMAKRWRLFVGLPLVLFAAAVVVAIIRGPRFTVSSAFLVQGGATASGASGLAARFGVILPQESPGQSPQLYGDLITSQPILRQLVVQSYLVDSATSPERLVVLFKAKGGNDAQRIQSATRALGDAVRTTVDAETGVVRFEVTTKWRNVSFQLSERLLTLLDEFNVKRRQSAAAAESAFTKSRVDDAATGLRAAEDSLEHFLKHNREFRSSPELAFQHDRLSRRVEMRQAVYSALEQALDNARLEAARNTPLIAVIDPPRLPAQPDRRYLFVKAVLSLVVGIGLAGAIAVLGEALARYLPEGQGVMAIVRQLMAAKP